MTIYSHKILRIVLPEQPDKSRDEVLLNPPCSSPRKRHPWTDLKSPSNRYRYGKEEEGFIPVELWFDKYGQSWSKGDGIQIIPDIKETFSSPLDKSRVTSKRWYRQHLKNNGCTEVGNEDPRKARLSHKTIGYDEKDQTKKDAARREDIKRDVARVLGMLE